MTSVDVVDFYRRRLARFGPSVRALAWYDTQDQELLFRILVESTELSGKAILDAGCGLGDLHAYLLKSGIEHDYAGIDIVPEFIALASAKYPEASFRCADILSITPDERWDVVLASGLLGINPQPVRRRIIRRLFECAREVLAFNAVSTRGRTRVAPHDRMSPEATLRFALGLSPWVSIRHDYLEYDFTIVVRRSARLT